MIFTLKLHEVQLRVKNRLSKVFKKVFRFNPPVESKAERIEAELAKLRCPKSEISIQTSFLQETEKSETKTEEKSEDSWEVKLREEQVRLQAMVAEQGALLNKAVENLEKLEESRNLAKSTTSTTYLDLPTPRSTE